MEDDRQFSAVEKKWINRLKRCLKEMPDTLELNVGHGQIAVCNVGAMNRALEIDSSDNLIVIEHFRTKRINPDSESL